MTLLSKDPKAIAAGTHVLRTLSIAYPAFTVGTAFDLAQAGFKAYSVWPALNPGWTVQTGLLVPCYRQGHWKEMRAV